MLVVLVKTFLIKLKIVLNSNYFIGLVLMGLLIYPLLILININKEVIIPHNKSVSGIVKDYKINGNKLTIKTNKDYIIYYFKDEEAVKKLNIGYGYHVKLKGSYSKFNKINVLYNFNNQTYQKLNGYDYYFKADQIVFKETKNPFYKLKNKYFNYLKSRDNYDYYLALLMGNKSYLDGDLESIYTENGISHLLSMSGLHLGLFIFGINYLLKLFHIPSSKRIIFFSLFLLLLLFMCNYSKSLLRASLFFLYLSLNKKYKIVDSNNKVLLYVLITCLLMNIGLDREVFFSICC